MKTEVLTARVRTETGSRACRKLRAHGEIPANLYGAKENVSLAVNAWKMNQLINAHASLLEIAWDGRKELVQVVEVQRNTFGDDVMHVDMHKIDVNKPITGEVDLVFKGEPKGVKAGGHMMRPFKSLEVEALPRNMPREIVIRVDDIGLNEGLHIEEIPLPEGVKALGDPRALVVTVIPHVEVVEEETLDEAGAAEPEVIAKGKQDEEEG